MIIKFSNNSAAYSLTSTNCAVSVVFEISRKSGTAVFDDVKEKMLNLSQSRHSIRVPYFSTRYHLSLDDTYNAYVFPFLYYKLFWVKKKNTPGCPLWFTYLSLELSTASIISIFCLIVHMQIEYQCSWKGCTPRHRVVKLPLAHFQ